MVVEIPNRLPNRHSHRQHGRDYILSRRFAGTASDTDYLPGPLPARPSSDVLERREAVSYKQNRTLRRLVGDGRHCALLKCFIYIGVAFVLWPTQGEKQISGHN